MNKSKNIAKGRKEINLDMKNVKENNKCGHSFFNEFGLLWEYVYDKNHSVKYN